MKPRISPLPLALALGVPHLTLGTLVFAQSGPVVLDLRGADGGHCAGSNGCAGADGRSDLVLTQSGLNIKAAGTSVTLDVSGGNGGDGDDVDSQNHWGGRGGMGRIIEYTVQRSTMVSTGGTGISALSRGGDGGKWADAGRHPPFGSGGDGHAVVLAVTGSTIDAVGYGISAQTIGGNGQDSAIPQFGAAERDAGAGGNAVGPVSVTLDGKSTVTVRAGGVGAFPGEMGAGIRAQALGGQGGGGRNDSEFGGHANSGKGGSASDVTVTAADGIITTQGARVAGILARSIGGTARTWHEVDADGLPIPLVNVKAADGGNAGHVTVVNGAALTTGGARSPGILAASIGGDGSDGGQGSWLDGHDGGKGGAAGGVAITNTGSITTHGANANGISALVIGGSGGAGGPAGTFGRGGNGGAGAGTGTIAVQIDNSGTIATEGQDAAGIFAHAVGGGGGAGTSSHGVFRVGGGNGGNGGNGGVLAASNQGTIRTAGDHSQAVLLQSIGGGGGAGGDADSVGLITAMAVGGRGGAAGDGGNISLGTSGDIATAGAAASGLTLQSIGGGGGLGGSARATSAGVLLGVSMSVGGDGGAGGSAGAVAVNLAQGARVATSGALANAVVAQTIGGGGGNGAFADSTQVTIAPVLGPDLPSGAASIGHTMGGTGGAGGSGGTIGIDSRAQLATTGAHADGILAQSIGGGGGNGGTAAAPLRPTTLGASDITISYGTTVGGNGGGAGNGSTVTVDNLYPGSIRTEGDHAIGILAQSIGGGGGSGGSVQQETGRSFSTLGSPAALTGVLGKVVEWLEKAPEMKLGGFSNAFDMRIGGQGGSGGNGGAVTVSNEGSITTGGGSAPALVAQSIGGGGGRGGAVHATGASSLLSSLDSMIATVSGGVSGAFALAPDIGVNLAVGGGGGSGGNGAAVHVANIGDLATAGTSAPAILAQSIGGGGGRGTITEQSLEDLVRKQAGAAAPEILARINKILGLLASKGLSITSSIDVSLGRSDGPPGVGGAVTVDASGIASRIETAGDSSPAILAQSIGGGGGTADVQSSLLGAGGLAALAGTAARPLAIRLGATSVFTGDTVANGSGQVTAANGANVRTQGRNAVGIFAQSISGGGGAASVSIAGTDAARLGQGQAPQVPEISLGATLTGLFGDSAMSAGGVAITQNGTVRTTGLLSHGVLAQSISGGGGAASLAISPTALALTGPARITLGASGMAGSGIQMDGGSVSIDSAGTSDGASTIVTTGALAFGMMAQSVGAGGGYVALTSGETAAQPVTLSLNASDGVAGGGGAVSLSLGAGASITTGGQNAVGMLGQSIGGGGGIAALGTRPGLVTLAATASNGSGDGGPVRAVVDGGLQTTGSGGVGVLAQSVGGGGGLAGDLSAVSYGLGLVRSAGIAGGSGRGGPVTVEVGGQGMVYTTGDNAPGILAMSLGGGAVFKDGGVYMKDGQTSASAAGGPVSVHLAANGAVSTQGANSPAIAAVSWGAATGDSAATVDIAVDKGASVSANGRSGTGVLAYAQSMTTIRNAGLIDADTAISAKRQAVVENTGTIRGNVDIGRDSGLASTFNNHAGATFYSGNTLYINNGTLNNAGTLNPGGPGVMTTTRLNFGSFNQLASGTLAADLDFAGKASDQLSNAGGSRFAGTVTPLTRYPVRGTALAIIHSDQPLAGDAVQLGIASASPVFAYALRQSDDKRNVLISVDAHFQSPGAALNRDQAGVANHLQALWNTADARAASVFDPLAAIADPSAYARALNTIASDVALARASSRRHENYAFLNRLMSCPYFSEGDARQAEGECAWGRAIGGSVERTATSEDAGYRSTQGGVQFGVQKAIAPDWYLGGSFRYAHTSTRSADGAMRASSDGGQAGLTLKRQLGNWLFAGALFGGYEASTQRRDIALPRMFATANSKPDTYFFGARARASYQVPFQAWYLKPFADLDVTYDHTPAYRESGAGVFNLAYGARGRTAWMVTPGLEVGGRVELAGATLRPYLAVGASALLSGDATASVSLAEFSAAPFQITTRMPKWYGDATAGFELLTQGGWAVRAEYRLRGARDYVDQSGMLRVARYF
ncbi:autotransporter outer membrane beta-barrel domain-containing protein [Cupriavidus necator]|uniref:autotransporter outer membrane beta-barrel domain-containing protein n=1 Tax=Cupriavidus necator TaxID=106590 RepID=UPI003ECD579A